MIIYSNLKNSFEKKSKGLIPKILSAITPNFIYGKDNSILREMVVKSNLFPASLKSSLNPFYCKNYLAGNINEIEVKWYDIYFTKLKKISILFWFIPILNLFFISYYFIKPIFTKQSIDEIVDFQGLFMVANYNKKFKGTTVVIPDRFEKSFGFLANSFQKLSSKKGEFVYLENVDFEKEFVVYSSDQIEARIILSPRMMERIIQLNKKSRRTIMLSFVDGIIFSAIYRIGGFINFSLTRSIKKGNALRETYNNLKFCVDIIEDLQLDNNFSIK
ncbi:MAG: DUF3137 domain-containing protein [Ignavibacteriales bacterium]|nr:DUF3137 domain-containing protein [Ignavibacteriales bacterium]